MEQEAYLTSIHNDAKLLADAARHGLASPVSCCPGWLVADVVGHIGFVHRLWAYVVRHRLQAPVELPPDATPIPLPGLDTWLNRPLESRSSLDGLPEGVIAWSAQCTAKLEDALRAARPDETVWSWSDNHHVSHHLQMQAIETLIHRWDVEEAHGRISPIDPEVARDGIDQHFDVMLPAQRRWTEPQPGNGESFHFHRTDGPGEWYVRFVGAQVEISREHAKADVALRGSAADLLLFLWRRRPAETLDVVGDLSLAERYFAFVPPA